MTHHEEITQEVTQLWNVAHLDDEEFVEEATDALGHFPLLINGLLQD
jgi:hypothetical protein